MQPLRRIAGVVTNFFQRWTTKTLRGISGLRQAVRQGQPGQWASDHGAESQHFTGWNYVAIHAMAKLVMQAKVAVYRPADESVEKASEREDTGVPVEADHRYLKLQSRPNKWQSGSSFRYEQVVQLGLTGSCLVWKVRNAFGLTVERYVLPTCVCAPIQPHPGLPLGGFRVMPHGQLSARDADGFAETTGYSLAVGKVISVEDMMIIRLPHPIVKGDGFSPTAAASKWIDTAAMLDSARWAQMHNGPDPSMLVSPPKDYEAASQTELDAYEKRLNQKYGGVGNHGKIFVATHGAVSPLSTNPKDMSYVEGFEQLRDSILAIHGTNKAAVGLVDNMTYGSIAAGIRAWVQLTVQPMASLLAEEDTEQQSVEFEENLTLELTCPTVDDPEILEQQIQTDLQAGAITVGEIRMLRGRKLFNDERDDRVAGSAGEQPAAAPNVETAAGVTATPTQAQSDTALNGAQIDSLLSIVEQVSSKVLPVDSAKVIIGAAFQTIPPEQIEAMLAPLRGVETAAAATATGTGELGNLSRQQLIRNRRAIDDVLNDLASGKIDEQRAKVFLSSIGLAAQTIDGLLATPNDESELQTAAGEVNGTAAKTMHEYASVLAIFPIGIADEIREVARKIPKSALADKGIENEPHLTIMYGLLPVAPRKVARLLQTLDPVELTIGNIAVFEADESRDTDVVILEVESEDAVEANEMLNDSFAHREGGYAYRPHITLAYVQAGKGKQYAGECELSGQVITVDKLVFSGVNGARTVIPLSGNAVDTLYGSVFDRMRGVSAGGNGHS